MVTHLVGVDDGLVAQVRHNRINHVLTLVLRCGHLQMGYYDLVLTYEEVILLPQDEQMLAHVARTTRDDGRHKFDLANHELDRAENGSIEHRLLFHPNVWFTIRCGALHWQTVSRSDRRLPPLSDRILDDSGMSP